MPGGFWKRFYLGQRADPLVRAVLSSNLVRRLKPAVPGCYRAFALCLCFGLAGAVSAQESCSYFAHKFEAQTFAASGQNSISPNFQCILPHQEQPARGEYGCCIATCPGR